MFYFLCYPSKITLKIQTNEERLWEFSAIVYKR